ncbi:recombinase [Burkholderia lata]|uniref:recombinase family protein n=1 Tax=Burkholderia lata (strain ATCC 17760 / DSM 23089 / LMG 22485 / NCIMB 9086 / R18194 / 383) TaxID=482957 RepID=UPI00145355C8|nr:recombinase family protein [Burkholderia lata]VWD45972.1 recombinase [Burkholderia lata]
MATSKKTNSKVYSYLRFSDPKQAAGSSADRQMEYAARWAAEHGMLLDASLTLRDEGLSAFHQRHIKQGALGVFLRAVEDGRILSGSVLIVEGLDRLSRAEPIQAQAQLAQIINAGITVVTASDGREYNRERLKAQPMDLVYSLLVMIRAHEESDTKSKRVKAAIRRQCEGWVAGTWRGVVRNGKDPHWVQQRKDGAFELYPERALAIRTMIDLFLAGHGATQIAHLLSERKLYVSNAGNYSTHMYRIVRNRALIGEKPLTVDGDEFRLAGYYPALLTDEEFATLQDAMNERGRRQGKGEIPGILTGLTITSCGYCGMAIASNNAMHKRAKGPELVRRLTCTGTRFNVGCPVAGTCDAETIERALMRYCSDQFNLTRLLEGDDGSARRTAQLAIARQRAAEIEAQIHRVTDALLSDDGAAPAAFMRRARELETELTQQRREIEALEHQIAASNAHEIPAAAEAWAQLVDGVLALDYDARLKARQLVADTFRKIVLFQRGFMPLDHAPADRRKRSGTIGLLLVTKRGGMRLLNIDRKTGQWEAEDNLDLAPAHADEVPLPQCVSGAA